MNTRTLHRSEPAAVALALCMLVASSGAHAADPGGAAAPGAGSPSHVENPRAEDELTTLRITAKAVERLGVRTVAVEQSDAAQTRRVGGIVMTPPGRTVQVAAPNEGVVLAVGNRELPYPGAAVRRGQALLRLLAVSAPELAQAREIVQVAAARLAIAEEELASDPTSSAATAEASSARAALAAAEKRMERMAGGGGSHGSGLAPVTVTSPVDGVVRALAVSPGQSVPAGGALLEIVKVDRVWIRVPIFSGDFTSVAPGAPALVRRLSASSANPRRAVPVAGPPSADAAAASVDLYFELDNPGGELRPGERVDVTLELGASGPALQLPYAAVVYDLNGAAWVYEQREPGVFVRRRVEIRYVRDRVAVLESGPVAGTLVVTDGAAELFGAEFGNGQ